MDAEAIRAAGQRAMELVPESTDALDGPMYTAPMAQIHASLGRPEEALPLLEHSLARPPGLRFRTCEWTQRGIDCAMTRDSRPWSGNMLRRPNLAIPLLWLACVLSAQAEWRVVSSETADTGRAGVVHITAQVTDDDSGDRATVHMASFSTKTATLRVIDSPPESHAGLAETMQRENSIAGVNGGYFSPEYAPVGLLISDGRVVLPKQKARLLSGVVSVVNGRVQIQRAAEFSPKAKPTAARQCGPFLVEGAKPVAGLNDSRRARRTFVAVGGGERAAIGYSSHVTLAQLAAILATPGVAAEVKIQRALNLDGGSSSGFWFAGGNGPFSIREQKTVRDYVAIVPR